jgi:hypothetical protein
MIHLIFIYNSYFIIFQFKRYNKKKGGSNS